MSTLEGQNRRGSLQKSAQELSAGQTEVDMELLTAHLLSTHSKMAGLDLFVHYLGQGYTLMSLLERHNSQGVPYMQPVFKGLRQCLTVPESDVDVLLKTNQLLYDIMAEIHKHPSELQPEVASLIPWFIENLGNPKATVRKTTHKCIGTFVKFSRKLEYVLLQLVRVGLANQNQRTRQHSMLVIPALLSLKPSLVEEGASELHQLVQNVCAKLRDPAEIVAKTARKLLLELKKCYPDTFDQNFIEGMSDPVEQQICRLILDNQIDEAHKIIAATQPSNRMKNQPSTLSQSMTSQQLAQQQNNKSNGQFQPRSVNAEPDVKNNRQQNLLASQLNQPPTGQNPAMKSPSNNFKMHMAQQHNHSTLIQRSTTDSMRDSSDVQRSGSGVTPLLSVVGREIMQNNKASAKDIVMNQSQNYSEQPMQASEGHPIISPRLGQQSPARRDTLGSSGMAKKDQGITKPGLKQNKHPQWPMDQITGLCFGFIDQELISALDENQPWKERTTSMDEIESLTERLILIEKVDQPVRSKLCDKYAWDFLGFISKFVTDINFKISLSAIKIVQLLFVEVSNDKQSVLKAADLSQDAQMQTNQTYKRYFQSLVSNLIEKLGDSKQVIRDGTLKSCCAVVSDSQSAQIFVQNANLKNLQHMNPYAKECLLSILAKCFIVQQKSDSKQGGSLTTSAMLIEELCFLAKVEERKKVHMMAIDVLALAIERSNNRQKTESIIQKEIQIASGSNDAGQQHNSEELLFKIKQRQQAVPQLKMGLVEFQPEFAQEAEMGSLSGINLMQQHRTDPGRQSPQGLKGRERERSPTSTIDQRNNNLGGQNFQMAGPMQSMMQHQPPPPHSAQTPLLQHSQSPLTSAGKHAEMMHHQKNFPPQANTAMLQHQNISNVNPNLKTPSMNFLENKKQAEQKGQQFPQSAGLGVQSQKAGLIGTKPNLQESHSTTLNQQQMQDFQGNARNAASPQRQQQVVQGEGGEKIAIWLPSFTPSANGDGFDARQSSFGSQERIKQMPSHGQRVVREADNTQTVMNKIRSDISDSSSVLSYQQQYALQNPQLLQMPLIAQQPHQIMAAAQVHQNPLNQQNKTQRNASHNTPGNLNLNATASSSATFVDDGRSLLTTTTQVSSANKDHARAGSHHTTQGVPAQVNRGSPLSFETNKTASDFNSNFRVAFGQSQNSIGNEHQHQGAGTGMGGYIPEPHTGKPRTIHSNQDKQRVFNNSATGQQNMSQSSNGSNGGFQERPQINDRLQLLKSTYKYKTKFDGSAQDGTADESDAGSILDQNGMPVSVTNPTSLHHDDVPVGGSQPKRGAYLKQAPEEQKSIGSKKMSAGLPTHVQLKQRQQVSASAGKPPNLPAGHFQATQQPQQQPANSSSEAYGSVSAQMMNPPQKQHQHLSNTELKIGQQTSFGALSDQQPFARISTQPPVQTHSPGFGSHSEKKTYNSSTGQEKPPQVQKQVSAPPLNPQTQGSLQMYMADGGATKDYTEQVDQPLQNADLQFKKAIDDLKSADWQRQFDACNTLKRVARYHKNLLSGQQSNGLFKDMIKAVDNLRSQVSKNACMATTMIFTELSARENDAHIDSILPTVIKRSCDTNQFISQEAEKALCAICQSCSEHKVFSSLQSQNMKSNVYKEKVLLCYSVLIERLGSRLKNFREVERLIQTVSAFLDQGAIEVRNQAKLCVLTIQNACGGPGREFDGLLLKARLNERQMEKVKKVVTQEDFESLSQYANTRYGASMRASPMVAQGGYKQQHTQYGMMQNQHGATGMIGGHLQTPGSNPTDVGSDGGFSSYPRMQSTFLSGGAASAIDSHQGGVPIQRQVSIGDNSSHFGDHRSSGQINKRTIPPSNKALSNQALSTGFAGATSTQNTFKKRTTSVSKPVARETMEEFNSILDLCQTNDWMKRIKAIDSLQHFTETNAPTIRASAPSNFVKLVDAYSRFLQDPNNKVLVKAQQSFEVLLSTPELGALFNSNLPIVCAALTQELCSTNVAVRNKGDALFDLLEEVVVTESRGNANNLLLPIVSQLNQNNIRGAKPFLVERLVNLVDRIDKMSLIERHLGALLQPKHKIHSEANGNVQLKQALARLDIAVQNAEQGGQLRQY